MESMDSIHIDLHGFGDQDITDLRAFLAANEAVADIYEVHAIKANSVQDVLTAALADTTLVAEVLKEVAGAAVSISAIVQAIRLWISSRAKNPAQQAEVTVRVRRP